MAKSQNKDHKAYKDLALKYDFVYYGTVKNGEYTDNLAIRGMTASPDQIDENYIAGIANGYDIQLVQRYHDIYLLDNNRLDCKWDICRIQTKKQDWPRIILASQTSKIDHGSIIANYLGKYMVNPKLIPTPLSDGFCETFEIYVGLKDTPTVAKILTPEIQAALSVNFAKYDIEIVGESVYIYSTNQETDIDSLDQLTRFGVWFAEFIDQLFLV